MRLEFGRPFVFWTRFAAKLYFATLPPPACWRIAFDRLPKKFSAANNPGIRSFCQWSGGKAETNTVSRDLGEVTLTNHYETCLKLGAGKDCILTPNMLDRRNVQITLALESRTAAGKTHDLSVRQVVTRAGKLFEVAVGNFSLSLTPNIMSE